VDDTKNNTGFSSGVDFPELDHIVARIVNQKGAAEGTTLPPRQSGELRVPIVTGLKVVKTQSYFGGTQVTLVWTEPEIVPQQLSHFNVYVTGLLPGNAQPQGPITAQKSPAQIRLQTKEESVVVFTVQTVLKSGLMSLIDVSASLSPRIAAGSFTSADFLPGTIPVNALADGTPGQLISWDSTGVIGTFGAGVVDAIVVGTGANMPTFKTRTTLDLVEGRSNITTANLVVIVDSAGKIKESTALVSDFVLGAAALTTAGAVPYVTSAGTLTSDATKFFFDGTKLSIGTTTPAATVHAFQGTNGNLIQRLETDETNDNVIEDVRQYRGTTTNATLTTIATIATTSNTVKALQIMVIARRTGGSAGTAGDSARYVLNAVYKNIAGTVSIVGAINVIADEDQAGWDATFTVAGTNVTLDVTGALNNLITWQATARTYEMGS
jgi:hypothetical protein